MSSAQNLPLVSVIIPCYNLGHYLQEAIESIYRQNYPAVEIIVVDDGSTDNSKAVAENRNTVKYIYQTNQGLSAARNTGIKNSKGDFLLFLDADDWLLPDAIITNVRILMQNESLAFVSGAYNKVFVEDGITKEYITEISSDHYIHLLHTNYIGVPAAVLYRRWIFNETLFDVSLKSCQDYDLYLKIARKHPITHHTKKIAAYRIHASNMSSNIPIMLSEVLCILERQKKYLKTSVELKAYKKGRRIWKIYYCYELYEKLRLKKIPVSGEALNIVMRNPLLLFRYFFTKILLQK